MRKVRRPKTRKRERLCFGIAFLKPLSLCVCVCFSTLPRVFFLLLLSFSIRHLLHLVVQIVDSMSQIVDFRDDFVAHLLKPALHLRQHRLDERRQLLRRLRGFTPVVAPVVVRHRRRTPPIPPPPPLGVYLLRRWTTKRKVFFLFFFSRVFSGDKNNEVKRRVKRRENFVRFFSYVKFLDPFFFARCCCSFFLAFLDSR